jgi:hypothetical protein
MPKGVKGSGPAQTKQPEASKNSDGPQRTGMVAAQQQMSGGGSRFPYLRIEAGERARFHFLTSGNTDLIGSKFHKFGEGRETRHYMCLRVFTGGEEECRWCEAGHDEMGSRFAVWIFVHNILHAAQDKEAEWKTTKVGKTTLFREEVKEPMLIRMAAGVKQKWFSQFVNMWTTHGDLQNHIYELYREGTELETEYFLTTLKEQAIPEEILDSDVVKKLPTCEDVLREEVTFGPGGAGAGSSLGTDEVMGGKSRSKEKPAEEAEAADEPPADDDLI